MLLRAEKAALRKAVLAVLRELPGNTRLSQSAPVRALSDQKSVTTFAPCPQLQAKL